jgi:hypothetical protein
MFGVVQSVVQRLADLHSLVLIAGSKIEEISVVSRVFGGADVQLMLMMIGIALGSSSACCQGWWRQRRRDPAAADVYDAADVGDHVVVHLLGALFGGAITSILFNIREPWQRPLDGYPMAQQGRAGEALRASPRRSSARCSRSS